MSSTAPRGTDVKNKLPPNKTNNNKEIPAVPSGPTFPPSAVSNPGTIGTGPSFRPESNPNGSDFFGGIGSASFSSPSLVAVVVIRFFCIFIRLIRRVLLDDAEGNLPQRLVVALLVVVVANISLYSLSALKVCVCVSVCLSLLFLFGSGVKRTPVLTLYGGDSNRTNKFVVSSTANWTLSGLFYSSSLAESRQRRGRERLTLFFFTPSFPTTILRQNINTYSLSHTMFAATNVQQTAFVGKAVAMKSRATVRYESVVIYIRVIV
jgi:hypothetical protein